ncbi:NUDIX hydrolase [Streptomyces sp. NPDC102441]|uniref:NUDIX hydrolase n=1 Tax=Streptomyces sp. NPDC102441 TaxID=3366176 RepID=UPI00382CA913
MTTVTGPRSVQSLSVPPPIRRVREVAVFRNRFGTLFNDDVIAPSGTAGQYLRWQWNQEGVVVVPVGPGGYALVTSYRYPVHAASLEFPRGGVEGDEGLAAAAARELREETGLISQTVRSLGVIHADTGILASPVHVFVAEVDAASAQPAQPEAMESLTEPVWVMPEDLPRWLSEGRITCGVTLAALALVHSRHRAPAGERAGVGAARARPRQH